LRVIGIKTQVPGNQFTYFFTWVATLVLLL